jgi:hypothetical protein
MKSGVSFLTEVTNPAQDEGWKEYGQQAEEELRE